MGLTIKTCAQQSPLGNGKVTRVTTIVQANFAENVRQLKILGSCLVTVNYWVTAIYRAVMYSFDYIIDSIVDSFLIQLMFVLFCSKTWYISFKFSLLVLKGFV